MRRVTRKLDGREEAKREERERGRAKQNNERLQERGGEGEKGLVLSS